MHFVCIYLKKANQNRKNSDIGVILCWMFCSFLEVAVLYGVFHKKLKIVLKSDKFIGILFLLRRTI